MCFQCVQIFLFLITILTGTLITIGLASIIAPNWLKTFKDDQEKTRLTLAMLGVFWGGIGWLLTGYLCT